MNPYVLIIGAQKSGTTYLYENLIYSPELNFPLIKEINFFNEFFNPKSYSWCVQHRRNQLQDYFRINGVSQMKVDAISEVYLNKLNFDSYNNIFEFNSSSDSVKFNIDVGPEYYMIDALNIDQIFKNIKISKIIMIIRDPISRYVSNLKMDLKSNSFNDVEGTYGLIERSMYEKHIDIWRSSSQVGIEVVDYKLLLKNPFGFLVYVSDLIGTTKRYFSTDRMNSIIHKGDDLSVDDKYLQYAKNNLKQDVLFYEDFLANL